MKRLARWLVSLALAANAAGCGLIPERVSLDDPRLKPMFEAMGRVDRASMGFTPIPRDAEVRVEWRPRAGYDASITVNYEKVPISGHPLNRVSVSYFGDKDELMFPPEELTLDTVRPWLRRWGYAIPTPALPAVQRSRP